MQFIKPYFFTDTPEGQWSILPIADSILRSFTGPSTSLLSFYSSTCKMVTNFSSSKSTSHSALDLISIYYRNFVLVLNTESSLRVLGQITRHVRKKQELSVSNSTELNFFPVSWCYDTIRSVLISQFYVYFSSDDLIKFGGSCSFCSMLYCFGTKRAIATVSFNLHLFR